MGVLLASASRVDAKHPPISRPDKAEIELAWQITHGAPPIAYWEAVAQCETGIVGKDGIKRPNWRNRGRWAGGLGIMTVGTFHSKNKGTWERWGGEEFAPRPDYATRIQQIVVANRIAMFGYKTWKYRDPLYARQKGVPIKYWYDKSPTGFDGWGCIVGQPKLNPQRWGVSTTGR